MQYTFTPICKPNQLILGAGQTAVVTGWTPIKAIAPHLDPAHYAVIGQLYSASRGIDFLVRNLLANPHVIRVILLDATKEDKNAGSVKSLFHFFTFGFEKGTSESGKECWVIPSIPAGYIGGDIPKDALNLLRDKVACWIVADKQTLTVHANMYTRSEKPWGDTPLIFPPQETIPSVLPGTRYGHRIEGKTIADTWVKILHRISTTGTLRPTGYDGHWQELINMMAVITDEPSEFYFPTPNYLPVTPEFVQEYIPQILDDAPQKEGVKYTYGSRLRSHFGVDQIEQVIEKLIKEIDAASAVMSLWDVQDHIKGGSPCLNHIWVRVVDGELSLTAVFRSHDIFGAWVANAMGLRALQQHIRDEISKRSHYDLNVAPLIIISQSAHIYGDSFEYAEKVVGDHYSKIVRNEQQDYADPCGNFVIELVDGEIQVTWTSPSGEKVGEYRSKGAKGIMREICADVPNIQPAHAGYLGMELQKAGFCLQKGCEYWQDKNIA